jgi:calumenin
LLDLHLSPAMAIALVSITGLAGQKSPVTALLLYVACAFILLLLLASYSPCL